MLSQILVALRYKGGLSLLTRQGHKGQIIITLLYHITTRHHELTQIGMICLYFDSIINAVL